MRQVLRLALLVLLALAPVPAGAQSGADFPKSALVIETAEGKRLSYDIELALTPDQQMQGLMHRQSMPLDAGMLFVWQQPHIIRMWMRNTFIPLDMVFIDTRGVIVDIGRNTVPHSEEIVEPKTEAIAVLELNAGVADAAGIRIGDTVRHALLGTAE